MLKKGKRVVKVDPKECGTGAKVEKGVEYGEAELKIILVGIHQKKEAYIFSN